jgi:hypothetical protein
MNDVYDKHSGKNKKPNGILLQTLKSGLCSIDIDQPEKCVILHDLLNDCSFYVKKRKGYHFYYKFSKAIPNEVFHRGIADINVNLYFCPEYNLMIDGCKTNQSFKYELLKDGDIKELPKFAIDWINQLYLLDNIDTKKIIKTKKTGKFINPNIIIEKLAVESLKHIYDILINAGYFTNWKLWIKTAYMTRQTNNTEEAFLLFDEYSRKIEQYKNNLECDNRKVFYGKNDYDYEFDENGILYLCKKLDYKSYCKFLD